jgi:uncharacterized membrane protein
MELVLTLFQPILMLAAFLCSLVAGILFAFAIVVMPGIRRLDDASFIRAFQVVDGVVQDNQPLFLAVWVASVLALLTATVLGLWALDGFDRTLLVAAAAIYLLGVQLPTVTINIPLNNALQKLDARTMNDLARMATASGLTCRRASSRLPGFLASHSGTVFGSDAFLERFRSHRYPQHWYVRSLNPEGPRRLGRRTTVRQERRTPRLLLHSTGGTGRRTAHDRRARQVGGGSPDRPRLVEPMLRLV